jgi:hypothetical protein
MISISKMAAQFKVLAKHSSFLRVFFFSFLFSMTAMLSGCQMHAKIKGVNLPYQTVRKVVVSSLPLGLRQESMNGRELYSGYFSPKDWEDDATEKAERAYAKAIILNDSRPYDVDPKVYKEHKVKGSTYSALGEDKKLTQQLVDRIREGLADRRDDRNIIDDFRAF